MWEFFINIYDEDIYFIDEMQDERTAFWINVDRKCFKSSEIDDNYLRHIIYFVSEGRGWRDFLSEDKINNLYHEAYNRKLMRPDQIFILHSNALYNHGLCLHKPKYTLSWDGEYIKK